MSWHKILLQYKKTKTWIWLMLTTCKFSEHGAGSNISLPNGKKKKIEN